MHRTKFRAMYPTLLFLHNYMRWLVLLALIVAIIIAVKGLRENKKFSRSDNLIRHWSATLLHIQLIIGVLLYIKGPTAIFFWKNLNRVGNSWELLFFGVGHIFFMLVAIVLVTIGSAKAKRKVIDKDKYKTILIWYLIALIVILIAIPWPFSPLASRPYFR